MNEKREEIGLDTSMKDALLIMCEGNPGGLTVLMDLVNRKPMGFMYLLHLDDMNMRGSQIWCAYKDVCGEDMDVFIDKIKTRDNKMIDYINSQSVNCGTTEIVVKHGGSRRP